MSTIEKGNRILTLINVFTVEPENQEKLVKLLTDATEETMKHLPGFISANIHRSFDGTRVVNYAQWESQESFEAMQEDPRAAAHMQAAAAISQFDPILCEVSEAIEDGYSIETRF
jgi:quinol monooxygenase YgiN